MNFYDEKAEKAEKAVKTDECGMWWCGGVFQVFQFFRGGGGE